MPGPNHAGSSGTLYRAERRSPSPSAQQSMNKRDKRRVALQDRLNEITTNFAGNRDTQYRKQLQQYQADINYVTAAQLYDNKPLPEPGEDDVDLAGPNGSGTHRVPHGAQPGLANGTNKSDLSLKLGRHATNFVQQVNDAMEQRDADLVTLVYRHNFAINQFKKDYKFSVAVAEREHERLLESLRHRLMSNVSQKIAALQREKEKLDIADTNALLHNPTQFSMNSVASPGAPQSNRKTRHTRHRLDAEDVEATTNNHNGGNKRKRKAPGENENGSPGPSTNREQEHIAGGPNKDLQSRAGTVVVPAIPTLDRLFSDRELTTNLQQATFEVIQSQSAASKQNKKRKGNPSSSSLNADLLLPGNTDPTEQEDSTSVNQDSLPTFSGLEAGGDSAAASVGMDRTPSQLYHATRSAGRLQTSATPLNTLGELAGRQSGAELIGTFARSNDKAKRDGDEYQRAPPLSDQEASEDVRLMEAAIKREDEEEAGFEDDDEDDEGIAGGRGGRKLLDLLLADEPVNYVGPPGFIEQG